MSREFGGGPYALPSGASGEAGGDLQGVEQSASAGQFGDLDHVLEVTRVGVEVLVVVRRPLAGF
ncbi:MAG: hypothetical protein JSS49_05640 [Planctomycetes bacterium]|nr:hypothetical protein [Planctomycetota bacterium]